MQFYLCQRRSAIFLGDAHLISNIPELAPRYLNVELPRSHRDRSRCRAPGSDRSWVRRYHRSGTTRYHTRAPLHTLHMHTRDKDTTATMTTKCLRRWSHAIESRTRYEYRRLHRVVRIVTWRGSRHVCFSFFFLSLSCSSSHSIRQSFCAFLGVHAGYNSVFTVPRVVPVRATIYSPGQAAISQERSGTGPTSESVLSRRSYLHVNDGTVAASWLVIGFRLRAPLRRPRRPPSSAPGAGDIDVSL